MQYVKEKLRIGWPECEGKFITYPCFVDAKIDGELGIFDAGQKKLFNKNGYARWGWPVTERLEALAAVLGTNYLWGELHWEWGSAGDLYRFLSHKKDDDVSFTVFDYDSELPMLERRENLLSVWRGLGISVNGGKGNLSLVASMYAEDEGDYKHAFKWFTEKLGYEGVVCKHIKGKMLLGRCAWVKVKKKETADLYVLSADPVKERVGLSDQLGGKELCGCKVAGMSKQERDALVGKIVEVEYLQKLYNEQGTLTGLRNPVFKRVREDKNVPSLR